MNAQEIMDCKAVADEAWHRSIKDSLIVFLDSYIRLCNFTERTIESEERKKIDNYIDGKLKTISQRKIEDIFSEIVKQTSVVKEMMMSGDGENRNHIDKLSEDIVGNYASFINISRSKRALLEDDLGIYRRKFIDEITNNKLLLGQIGFLFEDEVYIYNTVDHKLFRHVDFMKVGDGKKNLLALEEVQNKEVYYETTEKLVEAIEKVL